VDPDFPDGSSQQPRRPRKRWLNRGFLLSPVASVRIRLPGSPQEVDHAAEIGAQAWQNANPSGKSGIKKRQVGAFLLRHSRLFPRKKAWGARYRRWLQEQGFEHPADQIVLQELVDGVRVAEERLARLGRAIEEFLPTWSLAPIVEALQALRGVDLVTAATFVVEVGDVRRFESPRQLMAYLGLVPGERSTGETVRRGSITKMGNARVRHLLVESAWTYRHPPRVGAKKLPKLERVSPRIREIAWKAQSRLTARYRAFVARGKKTTVTCTAIARELAAFMWAVAREVRPAS
jgi:transposase